jgi:hypothetical protein
MAKHILQLSLCIWLISDAVAVAQEPPEVTGQWYGTFNAGFPIGPWASQEFPTGGIFEMLVLSDGSGQYGADVYIADLGLFDVPVPMVVAGNAIAIGDPQFAWGTIDGDVLTGVAFVPHPLNPTNLLFIEWLAHRQVAIFPGLPSPAPDNELPPLLCTGHAEYCSELLPFEPVVGPGFLNYLVKDETWDDQYRSYVRRDLMQAVKYAAAKVESRTSDWEYGNFAPLGLGDMSDANGQSPATNGIPDHLTHEDGNHIDIAYYQLYATDNLLRPVGRHQNGYLTATPYALDRWRTALFLAYLSEHPHLRYVAVDEQVGLALEEAFLDLEELGWIDAGVRAQIPLVYGEGVTAGHHDHMHVAMNVLHPIVANAKVTPQTLNRASGVRYVTAHLELAEGYDAADIDVSSLALIVNGHTLLYGERSRSQGSDMNEERATRLTVQFDGSAVSQAIGVGSAEIAIIGSLEGLSFQVSDRIRVVSR